MNDFNLPPVVRITLDNMKQQMAMAFQDYQGTIAKYVNEEFDRVISEKGFEIELRRQIAETIEKTLQQVICTTLEGHEMQQSLMKVLDISLGVKLDETKE